MILIQKKMLRYTTICLKWKTINARINDEESSDVLLGLTKTKQKEFLSERKYFVFFNITLRVIRANNRSEIFSEKIYCNSSPNDPNNT